MRSLVFFTDFMGAIFPNAGPLVLSFLYLQSLGLAGCAGARVRPVEAFNFRKLEVLGEEVAEKTENLVVFKKKRRTDRKAKNDRSFRAVKKQGAHSAFPIRRGSQNSIGINEKFSYQLNYLGLQAGEATLEVLSLNTLHGREVYQIQANFWSSPILSLVYRFQDRAETFLDYSGLFSHGFHVVLDESKQSRDTLELYDSTKGMAFYWSRWNHQVKGYQETKESVSIPILPQDSLSALYYLRMLPLSPGEVIQFPLISEGKVKNMVCTVARQEFSNGEKSLVVKLELYDENGTQKPGEGFLWLTDDYHRIPLKLEVKVRVGKMIARLKERHLGSSPHS